MSKPKIAALEPAAVELEAGTHFWCSCGHSENQPFCDGAHIGSAFSPLGFELTEKKKVFLCQCKATKNPPYCDGAHSRL